MIEALLAKYGLLGIFFGAGIEGEAATIAGGVLAHKGVVSLWEAMIAAATGSCIVDQIYFFLGRHFRGYAWIDRLARKPAFDKALSFIERYPMAFILGFRFVYGMRTISPIAIGTTRVPVAKFVPLTCWPRQFGVRSSSGSVMPSERLSTRYYRGLAKVRSS